MKKKTPAQDATGLPAEFPATKAPRGESSPEGSPTSPAAGPEPAGLEPARPEPARPERAGPEPGAGPSFADLGLSEATLKAIDGLGYEAPTPIQAAAIPPLLEGRDLFGQAQTGTGKTAAFALPLLSRVDLKAKELQILVLTPTRELAIQVAEAMMSYARHMPGFHVLPVYGGQDIDTQLRALRRGVHAVVGTPGRIQDHLRRGTLKLDRLFAVVLDEGDEMLRMGFIDEVEAILELTPADKQVALFSATLPEPIKKVARRHLRKPVEIHIAQATATVSKISQRYWPVSGIHKLDALTRILEVEDFEAMLIFVRTKVETVELAEKLEARGFSCSPLNGDMNQNLRERTIDRLRGGQLDIVIATDVAARGLDVERVSHVVNYDIPYDTEAYIHRIGRTGRAGREGVAILFVTQREQHSLRAIERATRQPIERMRLPSRADIADRRVAQFKQMIAETLAGQELEYFTSLIEEIEVEQETSASQIAAALTFQLQKERPLLPDIPDEPAPRADGSRGEGSRDRGPRSEGGPQRFDRYRIEVGRRHGVQAKNIVGAIANEAGIEGRRIGEIDIQETYSLVDLPENMPGHVFRLLRKTRVCGQELRLRLVAGGGSGGARDRGPDRFPDRGPDRFPDRGPDRFPDRGPDRRDSFQPGPSSAKDFSPKPAFAKPAFAKSTTAKPVADKIAEPQAGESQVAAEKATKPKKAKASKAQTVEPQTAEPQTVKPAKPKAAEPKPKAGKTAATPAVVPPTEEGGAFAVFRRAEAKAPKGPKVPKLAKGSKDSSGLKPRRRTPK